MEATFRGKQKYWLLHIENIIGSEMWKPLLEELLGTAVILVTTYTEHKVKSISSKK